MEPMVSIIVPTYNRENVIERAVNSILRQGYEAYEVIVVDDGSADHTADVIGKIQDDRIRYIKLPENQGVAHARNVGIQEAKYDYIAFLDSDDEWMPDKLELQMKKLMNAPKQVGLVYCRMEGMQREGKDRYLCPSRDFRDTVLEGNMFELLLWKNVIGTPSVLIRKECLEQAGGFKETLQCLEDWELFLRIARNREIGFVDEVLVKVHKSEGSVSTNAPWYLIARCYMVSLYRQEMKELGSYDVIVKEILHKAGEHNLYEEIRELLTRDIAL